MLSENSNDALNDVYGKMFYHIQRQFVNFQANMQRISVNVDVVSIPLLDLPACMGDAGIYTGFDRIEASGLTPGNLVSLLIMWLDGG